MSDAPPTTLHVLRLIALIVALLAVATPAFAANDIYKYVDDEGIPHYTDQWQLIPEKYRGGIQALDPETGEIFRPESKKALPPARKNSASPSTAHKDQAAPTPSAAPPFYAAWIEQFSRLSISVPSQFQLGIGLMSAMLVWGALKVMRLSGNPLVKLMLKGVITIVLVGSAYSLYMTSLNDRISNAAKASTPQSISGKDVLQNIQGTTEKAKKAIAEKVAAPLEKIKDATAGDAIRTRDTVNQSYRDQEKTLNKIESGP